MKYMFYGGLAAVSSLMASLIPQEASAAHLYQAQDQYMMPYTAADGYYLAEVEGSKKKKSCKKVSKSIKPKNPRKSEAYQTLSRKYKKVMHENKSLKTKLKN